VQQEPRAAISTNCRECGQYYQVQDALRPRKQTREAKPEQKQITCFDCGAELQVALGAESTMCKRCSSYVDLHDYRITSTVSKNFRTKGAFVVEAKGYVMNTEALVGDAVIKGRLLGKLDARHSLTLFTGAEIKGSFTTARLIIPASEHFAWAAPIRVGSAEISGELVADLRADDTIYLRSTARLFGNVRARAMVVEPGAVVVGTLRIGSATKG
jgi:cytoskeletal protein CcmA (bactofilin family)